MHHGGGGGGGGGGDREDLEIRDSLNAKIGGRCGRSSAWWVKQIITSDVK